MSKPTNDALQQVKLLMTIPENSICADCQKKVAKWASSTLGVFICIDCSGIHRSLGTHISFVRSCTLDSWTPEQARLMRRVGNKVANEFWEARLPAEFMRPSPGDRFGMENFIRAKYVERAWAAAGDPPHLRKLVRPSGSGARAGGNMYEGYFAHNPVQQPQAQHYAVPKAHQFERRDSGKAPSAQAGMKLEDFMNQLNGSSEQFHEEECHECSSFSFMNRDGEEDVKEKEKEKEESSFSFIADSQKLPPKSVTPPPPQVEKSIGVEQPIYPKTSTAMEIMNGKKTTRKQALFSKPKGVNRFIKKPGDGSKHEPQNIINFDVNPPAPQQQQTVPQHAVQQTHYDYSQPQPQYSQNPFEGQQYQNNNPFENQQNTPENQTSENSTHKSGTVHHFNVPNPFSHQQ